MRGGPRRTGRLPGTGHHEEAAAPQAPPAYVPAPRPVPGAGGVFKNAAVEVLRRTRRLMTTGEICRLALEWGLLSCSGKTPEATMASAMYGDIKRKDRHSLFIRPQEGMFGLREWVDQGFLPLWQLDGSSTSGTYAQAAYAAPPLAHCHAARYGAGGGYSAGAAMPMMLVAVAAAVATSPAKRSAPANGAALQQHGSGTKGPGRPKKVRRSRGGHGEEDDDEWSDGGDSLSDSEQREGSGDDEQLEPKQYSLRKGQVGRLQDAVAAAAAASPARRTSSLDPSTLTGYLTSQQQQQQQQQHVHSQQQQQQQPQLGGLEPLDLPNLRPHSAEGSRSQMGAGRRGSAGVSGGSGAAGLFSPPLYAALLQSPPLVPSSSAGQGGNIFSSIFSPGTGLPDFRSPPLPSPLLAMLGKTPAGLPSLLSPLNPAAAASLHRPGSSGSSMQGTVVAALKSTAAAAVRAAGARPALDTTGSNVSAMVPVYEVGMAALDAGLTQQAQHAQRQQQQQQQQQQLGLPPIPPLELRHVQQVGQTPMGESAGGLALGALEGAHGAGATSAGSHVSIPEIVFKLPDQDRGGQQACQPAFVAGGHNLSCAPVSSSTSRGQAAAGNGGDKASAWGQQPAGGTLPEGTAVGVSQWPAAAAGGTGAGSPSGSTQIAAKIREVEGKVRQVEERWGPLSLKTAQAQVLLHRACRHPQAAAAFQREAAQALQRAHDIMQQSAHLGLVDFQSGGYQALMQHIQEAAAAGQAPAKPPPEAGAAAEAGPEGAEDARAS